VSLTDESTKEIKETGCIDLKMTSKKNYDSSRRPAYTNFGEI